jgi:hypothetical protein
VPTTRRSRSIVPATPPPIQVAPMQHARPPAEPSPTAAKVLGERSRRAVDQPGKFTARRRLNRSHNPTRTGGQGEHLLTGQGQTANSVGDLPRTV